MTAQVAKGRAEEAPAADQESQGSRAAALTDLPREAARVIKAWARTSPGRLSLVMVGLVVLSLLTGIIGMTMVGDKQSELDDLVNYREPVNAASQQIYRSLTDAEASSAAAFLSGSTGTAAQLRDRYQQDIAQAGSALAVAARESSSAGAGGTGDDPVRTLSTLLPRYLGILETANANNRQGFPVGASYLLQASNLMRGSMLPAAQRLYGDEILKLSAEQDDANSFPYLSAVLVLGLLVALFYAQRYLRRRTNRVYNVGLVLASLAVVLALLWTATALVFSATNVSAARDDGSTQVLNLSRARLLAVQARASENLSLVASNAQRYQNDFNDISGKLLSKDKNSGLLADAVGAAKDANTGEADDVRAAKDAFGKWQSAHQTLLNQNTEGQSKDAIRMAVGTDPDTTAAYFSVVDTKLGAGIEQARQQFVRDTSAAHSAMILLDIGVIVLCLLAAVGATVGIWQRLREYR